MNDKVQMFGSLGRIYDSEDMVHDEIACEVVTGILEIPGVREAVMLAALKDDMPTKYSGVETAGDIPFEFAWNSVFNIPTPITEEEDQ